MRFAHSLLFLSIAAAAAACGQKGPLVLPDAHTKAPVPVAKPAANPAPTDENKDKDKAPPAAGS